MQSLSTSEGPIGKKLTRENSLLYQNVNYPSEAQKCPITEVPVQNFSHCKVKFYKQDQGPWKNFEINFFNTLFLGILTNKERLLQNSFFKTHGNQNKLERIYCTYIENNIYRKIQVNAKTYSTTLLLIVQLVLKTKYWSLVVIQFCYRSEFCQQIFARPLSKMPVQMTGGRASG